MWHGVGVSSPKRLLETLRTTRRPCTPPSVLVVVARRGKSSILSTSKSRGNRSPSLRNLGSPKEHVNIAMGGRCFCKLAPVHPFDAPFREFIVRPALRMARAGLGSCSPVPDFTAAARPMMRVPHLQFPPAAAAAVNRKIVCCYLTCRRADHRSRTGT